MPKLKIDLKKIQKRELELLEAKKSLKQDFIGIDYIIDELIDYIRIWYLMPEVLTRPIIISLWGMTGVGKTDLVRKLVSKLQYQDRFVEVELSNSENNGYYGWQGSVGGILDSNGVNDGQPAIVLFDEIQRFSTLDVDGRPIQNTRFVDFWELLSDGKLAKREAKSEIESTLNSFLFSNYYFKKDQASNPQQEEEKVGLWYAESIKKMFNLNESLFEIADMRKSELLPKMQQIVNKKTIYEAIDHSKTLIIISGNLDEAFVMAHNTAEADIDADIFHAYTQKISVVDIKSALTRKFKPEQVARFGNIHLVYKSLRKKDFEALIEVEVEKIIVKNKELFGIELSVSAALKRLIYQNGVFPVQGVRPVFSSIIDILETNLSKFLFEALIQKKSKIDLDYDFDQRKIIANISGETHTLAFEGRVDKIRQGSPVDSVANTAVHEAGHAVAYAVLFGLAPLQLKAKIASHYAAGFTFPHQIYGSRSNLLNQIKVYLAGGLAEEIIFGAENATIGREHDRERSTFMAIDYIRKYGFSEFFQAYYSGSSEYAMNLDVTNQAIEEMMRHLANETRTLLAQHKGFLQVLSTELYHKGSLKPEDIMPIAQQHGIHLEMKDESYLVLDSYQQKLLGEV